MTRRIDDGPAEIAVHTGDDPVGRERTRGGRPGHEVAIVHASSSRRGRAFGKLRTLRRVDQDWSGSSLAMSVRNAWRRADWFARGVSARQVRNGALAAASFATRRQRLRSWPVLVKVDISPVCNLHCTYCVHATSDVDTTGALAEQRFNSRQRMPLEQFEELVDEIAPHTAAVALYYVGDPLVHPQLTEFCAIASAAGLNSHVSTNFSFRLSDARLQELVTSGPTHLTVCVDGMRQEHYERTRVGGDIDLVLRNLEGLLEMRAARRGR